MNDIKDAVSLADRVSRCEQALVLAGEAMQATSGALVEIMVALSLIEHQQAVVNRRMEALENGVTIAE